MTLVINRHRNKRLRHDSLQWLPALARN